MRQDPESNSEKLPYVPARPPPDSKCCLWVSSPQDDSLLLRGTQGGSGTALAGEFKDVEVSAFTGSVPRISRLA